METGPASRRRVLRQPAFMSSEYADLLDTPQAGPSRLPDAYDNHDSHEDTDPDSHPTPRLSARVIPSLDDTTPAARLRAVMKAGESFNKGSNHAMDTPRAPSDRESDFETPSVAAPTPSISRSSIKDLFSRALRDPGDTPQKGKGRFRSNSVDSSDVDTPNPVSARSLAKGKRKSLSDDEVEASRKSESSSMAAQTLNTIRGLADAKTNLLDQTAPTLMYAPSTTTVDEDTTDTETLIRHLESSQATPPVATSTPQQSMHMSSNGRSYSNLMDQDSEMQAVMKGFASYEASASLQESLLPSSTPNTQKPSLARRPRSMFNTSTRPHSPSLSDHKDTDYLHQREKDWNKRHTTPRPATPDHSHRVSPRNSISFPDPTTLKRRGSSVSLRSFDDELANKAGSNGSISDYRDWQQAERKELEHERERDWGRHRPRTPSSPNFHSLEHPTRPSSALSNHARRPSLDNTDEDSEAMHSRERNWNSLHPKWDASTHSYRPASPLASNSTRHRTTSLTSSTSKTRIPIHHEHSSSLLASPMKGSPPRTQSLYTRASSPLPPQNSSVKFSPPNQHSRSRTPIDDHSRTSKFSAPLSSPEVSPEPSSTPAKSRSHIPIRSALVKTPSSLKKQSSQLYERDVGLQHPQDVTDGDDSTDTDDDPLGRDPIPPVNVSLPRFDDSPPVSPSRQPSNKISKHENDKVPSPEHSRIPIASTTPPRDTTPFRPLKASFRSPSPTKDLPPDLPDPPSSSEEEGPPQTPFLRFAPNLTATKTPKPPGGWAETPLPKPRTPSAEEGSAQSTRTGPNLTVVKTPKPPGGWADTPLPKRHTSTPEDESVQSLSDHSSDTPVSRPIDLPAQTPAPPGGWKATPMYRRNVRFDAESEAPSESEASLTPEPRNLYNTLKPGTAYGAEFESDTTTESSFQAKSPSRSPRRTPSIHVVDAFGRKQSPEEDKPLLPDRTADKSDVVRVVDSMGNVIPETVPDKLPRNEAIMLLKNGVSELVEIGKELPDTSDADSSHQERLRQLNQRSMITRKARNDLRSQFEALQASVQKSALAMKRTKHPTERWRGERHVAWWAWALVQLVIILVMYRIAVIRSRTLFFQQYFNPFYPTIHNYYSPLDVSSSSLMPTGQWSIFTPGEIWTREGMAGLLLTFFDRAVVGFWTMQQRVWDAWGVTATPAAWPPT